MLASHFAERLAHILTTCQLETTAVGFSINKATCVRCDMILATDCQTCCMDFKCHQVADENPTAAVCLLFSHSQLSNRVGVMKFMKLLTAVKYDHQVYLIVNSMQAQFHGSESSWQFLSLEQRWVNYRSTEYLMTTVTNHKCIYEYIKNRKYSGSARYHSVHTLLSSLSYLKTRRLKI